jgi:hypothetical protein
LASTRLDLTLRATTADLRHGLRAPVSLLVLGLVLHAGAAQATPTIVISSPTAGQPVDPKPTIAIAYTSDDPAAPLVLASLRVTVNGFDWTGKFTIGADSASYVVGAEDELIGGAVTIAASIGDEAGTTASAFADYEVLPRFQTLTPGVASAGDIVTVTALGLDPNPDRNFALLEPDGLTAKFSEVDRANDTGRFVVPAGTVSGTVGLSVNGKVAGQRSGFTVPSVVPNCGGVRSLFAMADGAWLVAYARAYWWVPIDSICPPMQFNDGQERRFIKVQPGGDLLPLDLPAGNGQYGVRIIPDKKRSDAAILIRNYPSLPVVLKTQPALPAESTSMHTFLAIPRASEIPLVLISGSRARRRTSPLDT